MALKMAMKDCSVDFGWYCSTHSRDHDVCTAVAEEREACARLIESMESWDANAGQWGGYRLGERPSVTVKDAAAAIRARV